jgi:hypothetical protein
MSDFIGHLKVLVERYCDHIQCCEWGEFHRVLRKYEGHDQGNRRSHHFQDLQK